LIKGYGVFDAPIYLPHGGRRSRPGSLTWVQYLTDHRRLHELASLADLDLDSVKSKPLVHQVGREMAAQLQLVYFSRQDTKDAGFLETEHFGVRLRGSRSHFDLTSISRRWLRDMTWKSMADRLLSDPPRSRGGFDALRRAVSELSAYLEAQAPRGGHAPCLLTRDHMVDFVADQRRRAENGLPALSIYAQSSNRGNAAKKPTIVTKNALSRTFNAARRLPRDALESGTAETIGLDRAFIVALPTFHAPGVRRRLFPDDAARALAAEENLTDLGARNYEDRGLRDIWEALVVTGRRCGEVLDVRLECLGRLNRLPVFWHDQTKVGNYDQAIRIPERLYELLEQRQSKTIARFVQRYGRVPTPQERLQIALFPRRHTNRDLLKGASHGWFTKNFRAWVNTLDITHCVPHQARHTLATNLLRNGANLTHVKRCLGHVSVKMAEHPGPPSEGRRGSASGDLTQPSRMLTDARRVLGEVTGPVLIQGRPRRWLSTLCGQRRCSIHDRDERQPKSRRPLPAIGAHRGRGRFRQQLRLDAGLLEELAACPLSGCFPGLDAPARRDQTPPPVMNQQYLSEIFVEDPHLRGKRLRRLLASGREPLARAVELHSCQPDISYCGLYHPVVKRIMNHRDNIWRGSDNGMAPDNVLDAYATPRRRSQTIRTPHWSVKNPKFFARETRAYRQTAPALGRGSVPRLVVTNPSGRGTAPDRRIQAGTDVAPADSGAAARRAPAGRYLAEPLPRRPGTGRPVPG
jgi:integrase